MNYIDVFNGDADGICALQQLRLANPKETTLITGLKRDIQLLKGLDVDVASQIHVMDVSFDKNREDVIRLNEQGAEIKYFDHHFAGEIPKNNSLDVFIDTDANTCTSLIMNDYLNAAYAKWAVVGAFGDNLDESALKLAHELGLDEKVINSFKQLGICLNYNGYGFEIDDLIFHPKELYFKLKPYADPIDFINKDPAYKLLSDQYFKDLELAEKSIAKHTSKNADVFFLANEAWSKRVVGVYGNLLARNNPDKAYALLIPINSNDEQCYRVSVRAPLNNKQGADEICRQFDTGGGRKAAAGVNALKEIDLQRFVDVFTEYYN